MGGSLGLALRRHAGVEEVRGVDPDPEALRVALDVGAITATTGSVEEAADGAETVFLAAPVGALLGAARAALAAGDADTLVTDMGSAKAGLLAGLDAAARERFIGGHPICGDENAGVAYARADLFQGATWFLTPGPEARPALFERLHGLVGAVGARPVAIDADVHDRLMALVSHLPHVLAAALVNQAADTAPGGREALRSAGPSFGDMTRVAGANPPLWADILLANRDAVLDALGAYRLRLDDALAALERGDREALLAFVAAAADGRARLRAAATPAPARRWLLSVAVPNRPGALSDIATALGHAHINIEDLELRPGAGNERGELVLTLDGEDDARAAARLAAERGYEATPRPQPA